MKRSRLFQAFSYVLLLNGTFVGAQNSSNKFNPSFENVVLPSPNAAALGRFGDIKTGPSTGIPQIGIPIYTFGSPHFPNPVSISLDYFAGGVRVDEEPSCVGVGWALNGGGVITRTMNGIPDEDPTYGFISSKPLPTDNPSGNYYGSNSALHEVYAKRGDNACDVFSYNVGETCWSETWNT